jgi:alpha-D-ribose 1-methylphosphonate 5-triphosphate diphosphatase PhnM
VLFKTAFLFFQADFKTKSITISRLRQNSTSTTTLTTLFRPKKTDREAVVRDAKRREINLGFHDDDAHNTLQAEKRKRQRIIRKLRRKKTV